MGRSHPNGREEYEEQGGEGEVQSVLPGLKKGPPLAVTLCKRSPKACATPLTQSCRPYTGTRRYIGAGPSMKKPRMARVVGAFRGTFVLGKESVKGIGANAAQFWLKDLTACKYLLHPSPRIL